MECQSCAELWVLHCEHSDFSLSLTPSTWDAQGGQDFLLWMELEFTNYPLTWGGFLTVLGLGAGSSSTELF